MKEFIEKLIERLEEQKTRYKEIRKNTYCRRTEMDDCDSCRADHYLDAMIEGINKSKEIVNQLAEEYKSNLSENLTSSNGWIPCDTQEEPTENGKYLIYIQHYMNKDLYDVNVAEWIGEWKVAYEWNVVAWQPIATYNKESSMAKCKYPNEVCRNMTMLNGTAYCDSVPCSLKNEVPKQTNADKIRSMNDEELANWLTKITDDAQLDARTKCNYQWAEWLQSEAE